MQLVDSLTLSVSTPALSSPDSPNTLSTLTAPDSKMILRSPQAERSKGNNMAKILDAVLNKFSETRLLDSLPRIIKEFDLQVTTLEAHHEKYLEALKIIVDADCGHFAILATGESIGDFAKRTILLADVWSIEESPIAEKNGDISRCIMWLRGKSMDHPRPNEASRAADLLEKYFRELSSKSKTQEER